ncbi:cryptochrome/photolyase family protein [Pararobbsia alpina]|uniref:Deoxyribodipyrimidine photo-lyase n=1 Tax=Pararobbsia alpina TaxID=621374 RepID=A0A6S7CEX8_9BURK|nr:deoxyribodipyrimidine photo-lyase [Pararobbsia alpina]CAB3807823.1 Deoxyribodipyrimidine photo-lyase [Pararobbsia alpina]
MSIGSAVRPALVWFRDDLRVTDHPALAHAAGTGRPLVCAYVFDRSGGSTRPLGAAARWWLDGALRALDATLAKRGGRLVVLEGDERDTIERLVDTLGAVAVYWNRRYDVRRNTDAALKRSLRERGVTVESFNGALLNEPWDVLTAAGTPFQVFSAYWRAARRRAAVPAPLAEPVEWHFHPSPADIARCATDVDALGLLPVAPDWAGGLRNTWRVSEADALARLDAFVADNLLGYGADRDRPDHAATSRVSPYLRFGQLSPRQVWHAALAAAHTRGGTLDTNTDKFVAELGWREFNASLLYHHPDLAVANVRTRFEAMPWRDDPSGLAAWQRGETGYPLVDAGMRELWATGWMHNRVRMVVASFLIKHLLIDWRAGEAWFWDTLVDADAANNAANWQWVAGCGADAAPYFRIFNPVEQGRKFDPQGDYVRRWVPELAAMPAAWIHESWSAPDAVLRAARLTLGDTYPYPIVEHGAARRRALDAFATLKN